MPTTNYSSSLYSLASNCHPNRHSAISSGSSSTSPPPDYFRSDSLRKLDYTAVMSGKMLDTCRNLDESHGDGTKLMADRHKPFSYPSHDIFVTRGHLNNNLSEDLHMQPSDEFGGQSKPGPRMHIGHGRAQTFWSNADFGGNLSSETVATVTKRLQFNDNWEVQFLRSILYKRAHLFPRGQKEDKFEEALARSGEVVLPPVRMIYKS